ncbi:MAG: alkaline phosphatase family protein [Candidatus Sulfotelmatobacter sp.]
MVRSALLCLALLLVAVMLVLLPLNACGGGAFGIPRGRIRHVVIVVQENRTPDNLFHDQVLIARGADIASNGIMSSGTVIRLEPTPLGVSYDLSHAHAAFLAMYHSGKMDGANHVRVMCKKPPCRDATFKYVRPSDVIPYFQLAEQYTFGDRMFQTNQGPSFPAHQFLISGTSAPTKDSHLFAAENPSTNMVGGCNAASTTSVALIGPNGEESSSMFTCFEHETLSDELDDRSLSWRYYAPNPSSIWTAPNAIQHICRPRTENGQTACTGQAWKNVRIPSKRILTDIAKNDLAAVTWVTPAGQYSDHAGAVWATGGPSWVASIVNAIRNSPFWSNTAIIVTWDDWGGWYDHVPPPKVIDDGRSWGSGYVYGFRVPLIVISPYARRQYISHVNHDFGSILNFVEQVFKLSSLGYADARADDLSDCFDFSQSPAPFKSIDAPLNADYFINDMRIPDDPDID